MAGVSENVWLHLIFRRFSHSPEDAAALVSTLVRDRGADPHDRDIHRLTPLLNAVADN